MENKRTGFLTTLCVLTFIGSGLGLLGSVLGLIGSSIPIISMFVSKGTIIVTLIGLVSSSLCLYGAIQMWGLKKLGFTLYLLGALLSIVSSVVSYLTIEQSIAELYSGLEGIDTSGAVAAAKGLAMTSMITSIIINGLFVVLYNVNRKHLVN
jgi:hypothetical protein